MKIDNKIIRRKIRNDLTGKKYGKLTCIKPTGKFRNGAREWLCVCDCGKNHTASIRNIVSKGCKSCGCSRWPENKNSKRWQGFGDISGRFFSSIRHGALVRSINFNVDIEYLWRLFIKQNRLCKITGVPLTFSTSTKKSNSQTASLDRINAKKGYEKGNVQWVHKDINFMKQDFSYKEFVDWCEKVINYRKDLNYNY